MKHISDTEILFAGFLPWVKLQPKSRTYDYLDNQDCAFAQYLKAVGYTKGIRVITYSFYVNGIGHDLPDNIADPLRNGPFSSTFGALAKRLEAALV